MKQTLMIAAACLGTLAFTSCIKEEALNSECDITGIDSLWLQQNRSMFIGSPAISNDRVTFNIQKGTNRSALAPAFYLTPGATITMPQDGNEVYANGVVRDFSTPQVYTVHAADGVWKKAYNVAFNYPIPISLCSFEHYELDASGRYQTWYEVDTDDVNNPRRDYWATGNSGFALTGMGKEPTDYPTTADPVGVSGNCVKLITRATGSFGDVVGMPIAAGNLFIGTFNASQAMTFPLRATRFGLQLVGGRPLFFEGYYKYTAGDIVIDKFKHEHPELKDTCDIYAVLYEVAPDNFQPLRGDDVLSSERIVALARIDDPGEPQAWTHFKETFRPMNGKTFEEQRLREDGYAIAIVATSSREGANFQGAIGSTLYVDELRIVWQGDDNTE